jgi:hypothetical protein
VKRFSAAVLSGLLPLLCAGCISITLEGGKEGLPGTLLHATKLEPGRSTLSEVLRRMGPPHLLLRSGEIDRLYYVSWDALNFKLTVSAPIPVPGRSLSTDAFILGLGSEELQLARLEFDRKGILRYLQTGTFGSSSDGQYFAVDNRVVETFLEDRARVLAMTDDDDDDDDLEPKSVPKK